mmetsp:Transcript_107636/g.303158  ORF Transcript_107636/g.303158 Transcript_107636/m.303158 type:complete len:251 (+) Transcript_107636:556-1308(+)
MEPNVLLGVMSPYPTVVAVTMVSHMASCNVLMLSRGSTMKMIEENNSVMMTMEKRQMGKASKASLNATTMSRNFSNRRNVFSVLITGTMQRRMRPVPASSPMPPQAGMYPVAKRMTSGTTPIKSMRLCGDEKNFHFLGLTKKRKRISAAKNASKKVSTTAATTPQSIGSSTACTTVKIADMIPMTGMIRAYNFAMKLESGSSKNLIIVSRHGCRENSSARTASISAAICEEVEFRRATRLRTILSSFFEE